MPNIVLHKGQSEILADLFIKKICRNAVAVCSRGWGKSFFAASAAMVAVNELLQLMPSVTNKNVYIIAPTYSQATDIYFPLLMYTFSVADMCIKPPSKDTGRFIFPNGVELHLVSYEAVERLRGSGAYFVVCDEVSSWTKMGGHKEAWQGILEPCIVTRWSPKRAKAINAKSPGRSLTISTPKGYNYLYDLYNLQETDNTWKSYHFDYHSSPYLDAEEIERLRHTYDPLYFAREYLASFEESGNSVFYCFDRRIHVDRDIKDIEEHEDVYCCIDFNVSQDRNIKLYADDKFCEFGGYPEKDNTEPSLPINWFEGVTTIETQLLVSCKGVEYTQVGGSARHKLDMTISLYH
jgi:hypothetical protein